MPTLTPTGKAATALLQPLVGSSSGDITAYLPCSKITAVAVRARRRSGSARFAGSSSQRACSTRIGGAGAQSASGASTKAVGGTISAVWCVILKTSLGANIAPKCQGAAKETFVRAHSRWQRNRNTMRAAGRMRSHSISGRTVPTVGARNVCGCQDGKTGASWAFPRRFQASPVKFILYGHTPTFERDTYEIHDCTYMIHT